MEQLQQNIDISATQPIIDKTGNQVFTEGVVLRKVSKFLAGTKEDAIMPVPVYYNPLNGTILLDMIPKELRSEYENYNNERLKQAEIPPTVTLGRNG